jgi:hypothetical protein
MRVASTSSWSAPTTPTIQLEPIAGRKTRITPSSARSCRPLRICLVFIGSSMRTRRRISGAKSGRPVKVTSPLSLRVSPNPQSAVIGDADNVAGLRDLGEFTVAGEEGDRVLDRHRLAGAAVGELHAALQRARADAQEGDAVAVIGVHVRLHLEDEAADARLLRIDGRRGGQGWAPGGGA